MHFSKIENGTVAVCHDKKCVVNGKEKWHDFAVLKNNGGNHSLRYPLTKIGRPIGGYKTARGDGGGISRWML